MTILLVLLGIALNAVVLRGIFHTLFHPGGSGVLSSQGVGLVWRIFRLAARHRPEVLSLAGPMSLLLVIVFWALGLTLGWALFLWPYLPEQFLLSTGLEPTENAGFLDAVYVSLVALATLGYGEITPENTWLRMVAPLEALIGFGLITASISWILSLYPVLSRRRNLARDVALLRRSGRWDEAVAADDGAVALADILSGLTAQVISVRNDYSQSPITYYFHGQDRESALDVALPHIVSLVQQTCQHHSASVRLQSERLREAVRDLAACIAEKFLGLSDAAMERVLTAYAADHLRHVEPTVHEVDDALAGTGR